MISGCHWKRLFDHSAHVTRVGLFIVSNEKFLDSHKADVSFSAVLPALCKMLESASMVILIVKMKPLNKLHHVSWWNHNLFVQVTKLLATSCLMKSKKRRRSRKTKVFLRCLEDGSWRWMAQRLNSQEVFLEKSKSAKMCGQRGVTDELNVFLLFTESRSHSTSTTAFLPTLRKKWNRHSRNQQKRRWGTASGLTRLSFLTRTCVSFKHNQRRLRKTTDNLEKNLNLYL